MPPRQVTALRIHARWPCFALLVAIAAVLRFQSLTLNGLWYDELHIVNLASGTFENFFVHTVRDTHPPLFPTMSYFWWHLVGSSEFALRALPALLGVLAVAVSFFVYRRRFGTWPALSIAALTCTLPLHVYYSQEFRNYTLTYLAATLVTAATLEYLAKPEFRSRWLLAIASGLLIGSHYYGAFLILTMGVLVIFIVGVRRKMWGEVVRLGLTGFAICAPFLAHLVYRRIRMQTFWPRPVTPEAALETLLAPFGSHVLALAFALIVGGSVVYIVRRDRPVWRPTAVLVAMSVLPFMGVLVMSMAVTGFSLLVPPRTAISFVAPFIALAGFSVSRLPRQWLSVGVILLLMGLSTSVLVQSDYYTVPTKQPNREAVARLVEVEQTTPNVHIVSLDPKFEALYGFGYYASSFGLTSTIHPLQEAATFDAVVASARRANRTHLVLFYVNQNKFPTLLADAERLLRRVGPASLEDRGAYLAVYELD